MEDFVALPSRWRIALLLSGAVGFVALGLWMTGLLGAAPSSERYPPAFVIGMGWVSVGFFGFCAGAGVRRLFDRREQVRIGREGVRYVQWSSETIPWSEIVDVTVWSHRRQSAIILHLRDPARYSTKGLAALLAGANKRLTGGDVAITLAGTNRKPQDALAAIDRFRPRSVI